MTKLFISFEGIIAERDPSLFPLNEEIALIKALSSQSIAQEAKESIKPEEVKSVFIEYEIANLLSSEAQISDQKSFQTLNIDEIFASEGYKEKCAIKLLPNVKQSLEKLKNYERVILIQAVWLERAHSLVKQVVQDLQGLIDQYIYLPAKEDALKETFKSYSEQNEISECIFVTNSFTQLQQMKTHFPDVKRVMFNRTLTIKDAPSPCVYDYSCMTWLSLERLVTQIISAQSQGILKIGVLITRHKNDISKQESQHGKGYLLNSSKIYFPVLDIHLDPASQEQVDLIIHKLPYHFTPYQELHEKEGLAHLYARAALYSSTYKFYEPLESLKIVGGRSYFKSVLDTHLQHIEQKIPLKCPKWFLINQKQSLTSEATISYVLSQLKEKEIAFPIILQSDNATTHSAAHNLAIVQNATGLQKLLKDSYFEFPRDGPDLVVSQFIEHDQTLMKVYMVGHSYYETRVDPSITVKDVGEDEVFYIDKAKKKKGLGDKQFPGTDQELKILESEVKEVVAKTGIKLAGLDILRKEGTQEFYIIDLNHYPSYANLANFKEIFEEILVKEGQRAKEESEVSEELD